MKGQKVEDSDFSRSLVRAFQDPVVVACFIEQFTAKLSNEIQQRSANITGVTATLNSELKDQSQKLDAMSATTLRSARKIVAKWCPAVQG